MDWLGFCSEVSENLELGFLGAQVCTCHGIRSPNVLTKTITFLGNPDEFFCISMFSP